MTHDLKPQRLVLPIFCAVVALSTPAWAAEDNRAASFMPPPGLSVDTKKEDKPLDLTTPPPFDLKKTKTTESKAEPKKEEKKKVKASKEKTKSTPVKKEAKTEVVKEPPMPTIMSKPVNLGAPVAKAMLADVDPETLGLLSPEQGGLGASLWKDASRPLVDRLMPAIGLPTSSYTLNDLARRMFLTTAAAPAPSVSGDKPTRTLMSQRLEGLMNLGAVREAWQLFSVAEPSLIDPVTLTRLVEASLIGPESQKICEAVSGLMAAQSNQKTMQLDWQKTLLICQLRAGDKKAVQLSLDMMKEQKAGRDTFLQLLERNVLGKKKRLPRHLTPLRPTVLALLRESGMALPSYLYKKPVAFLVPELVLAKAKKSKDRILLAERSAAKGILTKKQLIEVYQSIAPKSKSKKKRTPEANLRVKYYQAALHEELPQKKIELIQNYLKDLPKTYQVGIPGQIAADVLASVPVTADYNSSAVYMARLFAMTGHMDKANAWLSLANEVATRVDQVGNDVAASWPVFALVGMVADGDYAKGLNKWLNVTLKSGDRHAARDYAGRVLLLLSASGYAVPEMAWQEVVELSQPAKQKVPSPVLLERMYQVAKAGRRGETILLSLLLQTGEGHPPLSVMVDTVRALRLAGLKPEMQSLAREILVNMAPAK